MSTSRALAAAMVLAAACRPVASSTDAGRDAGRDAAADADAAPTDAGVVRVRTADEIGPFERPFAPQRNVYYVRAARDGRARLLANLHGVCNPPGYACGFWVNAASAAGVLVCPEGNARCGPAAASAPTWKESFVAIDDDLERAVATVDAAHPGEIDREGAILTGFSLGAYAAADIAKRHPGRWPYLVLTEADVPLDAASLRKANVRAVAMLAGERGSQVAGARRTVEKLTAQGYPALLLVMRGAGHHYSNDIDALMSEAIRFVTSERDAGD